MTIQEFRNQHSVSNLISDPRFLPEHQKLEYWCLLRRRPIKGTFQGIPSGTSFGCMLVKEKDNYRIDIVDVNDTVVFKVMDSVECSCGANHTNFPQQHYNWCKKHKG
jgi:hypothetical protein